MEYECDCGRVNVNVNVDVQLGEHGSDAHRDDTGAGVPMSLDPEQGDNMR